MTIDPKPQNPKTPKPQNPTRIYFRSFSNYLIKTAMFKLVAGALTLATALATPASTEADQVDAVNPVVEWMSGQPYALGVVAIIVGAITAMLGKRWFPWIAATYAALSVIEFVVFTSAAAGWWTAPVGISLTLVVALAAAIPVGALIRRNIWPAVGLVGIVYGAYLGFFTFCFILVVSGWESFIALVSLTLVGAVVGGVLACKYGPEIVLIGTSFIGSYIFMRGWTYILGGFQSEAEIVSKVANHEILEVPVSYWWYMILFVVVFVFTSQWQRMKEEDAEELKTADGYYRV